MKSSFIKSMSYQAELQSPNPARPELNDLFRLGGVREVDLDTIPPALALLIENDQRRQHTLNPPWAAKIAKTERTAGFLQNSSSFCAVAIWL